MEWINSPSDDNNLICRQKDMMRFIPGGIHKCMADDQFTLMDTSESFLSLMGYTREEIRERFHDHYSEMIYEEDRAITVKTVMEQKLIGDIIEVEYRIQKKNGQLIWILDNGRIVQDCEGRYVFYCQLSDITRQREEQEQLRLSLERHKVIMDQAADIIFEWDIREDTLSFSSNWNKKFGYTPIQNKITSKILLSPNIHPEDIKFLNEVMVDTAAGVPYSETEFRIKDSGGTDINCRIRVTTQYDDEGHAVRGIGVISDISKEKFQRQILAEQAKRDALTGLFHKNAAKQAVEAYLEQTESPRGIMLIIDLDDFKQVNDSYGHLCGDALLADVAGALHKVFRSSDVVSRVGGDEFLVFLPGISKQRMEERIEDLKAVLKEISVSEKKGIISCSIGASVFPDHALDFNGLYRCADLALYQVKSGKKGGMTVFSQEMEEQGFLEKVVKTAVNTVIESDQQSVRGLMGQYCFRAIYDASDIPAAINSVLDIVGRAYDVSRVYIFEDSENGQKCSNTFEWCNTGVESLAPCRQNLAYEKGIENYRSNFDENGMFYCSDVNRMEQIGGRFMKFHGICSVLQCAILDKGRFCGYVGFDECYETRHWTKEQIETMSLVAKVVGIFLLKHRLEEAAAFSRETVE